MPLFNHKLLIDFLKYSKDKKKNKHAKTKYEKIKREILLKYINTINNTCSKSVTDYLIKNLENIVYALKQKGLIVYRVEARLKYRGKVGTSEYLLPLEAGLRIHPVYFIPYYPGSSIKGAMRAVLYRLLYSRVMETSSEGDRKTKKINKDHDRDYETKKIEEIIKELVSIFFGNDKHDFPYGISAIEVFDAYPKPTNVCVVPDIITPHYQREGQPVKSELDVKPNPILNFSIACNTEFVFFIAYDKRLIITRRDYLNRRYDFCGQNEVLSGLGDVLCNDNALINMPLRLLLTALQLGLGAKTTRGYGVFEPILIKRIG